MAKLKTDWILFLTILAMVGFGLVMLYSASSAVAELRYHVAAVLFRASANWCGPSASFLMLMYFKRRDYRRLNTPAWAFSGLGIVLGMLVVVYFADPRAHRWFQHCRARIAAAVRIRQARADSYFWRTSSSRRSQAINDRHTLARPSSPWRCSAFMVVVADLGTALVPVITAVIVFWVAGLERRYMLRVALLGAARWW